VGARRNGDLATHPHIANDVSLNAIFNSRTFAAERRVGLQPEYRVCGDDKLREGFGRRFR